MKIRTLKQALLILVLTIGCSSFTPIDAGMRKQESNLSTFNNPYSIEEIKPVIWGCNYTKAKQKLAAFENGSQPIHPLDLGRYLFYVSSKYKSGMTYYKELVDRYLRFMGELSNDSIYFRGNTFIYNFEHDEIPAGWWSGMANSALILGLSYANELGVDHSTTIDKLIQNLVKDYTLGGSSQIDGHGNKWVLEYVWDGMSEKDIKNVLNGFLFSVTCIGLANKVHPDSRLKELAQSGLKKYKLIRNQFYFEDLSWTKYDLQQTIEPMHYAIFNLVLLKAIAEIFPKEREWILKEVQTRQNILEKSYRIDRILKEDEHILLFSLLGAPHPYRIDTYPVRMDLCFEDESFDFSVSSLSPRDFTKDIEKRAFMEVSLTEEQFKNLKDVSVYSVYAGQETEIFSINKREIQESESSAPVFVGSEPKTFYDGSMYDGTIRINPGHKVSPEQNTYRNEISEIAWDFPDSLYLNGHQHIAIAADIGGDITSHKFYLYQEGNSVSQRYYIPLEVGPNLIVLNPVGFKGQKEGVRTKRLSWRIYTNGMEEEFTIDVRGVYWLKNNFQLRELLKDPDNRFKEKEGQGNIY